MLRPALRRVEGEGAGVRKAVEHPAALGKLCHRETVIFLIEEEAGLLTVLYVHGIVYPVLTNLRQRALRRGQSGQRKPALPLFHALEGANGDVVSLVQAANFLPVLAQQLHQRGKQRGFYLFHPHREGLRHQQIVELIHRESREAVGLTEDHAAAVELVPHDRLAVVPGVAQAAAPEGLVKAVIGVAGEQADADLALFAEKARAEIAPLLAHRVHQRAVLAGLAAAHVALIDPGVPLAHPAGALFGDGDFRKGSFCFHIVYLAK